MLSYKEDELAELEAVLGVTENWRKDSPNVKILCKDCDVGPRRSLSVGDLVSVSGEAQKLPMSPVEELFERHILQIELLHGLHGRAEPGGSGGRSTGGAEVVRIFVKEMFGFKKLELSRDDHTGLDLSRHKVAEMSALLAWIKVRARPALCILTDVR